MVQNLDKLDTQYKKVSRDYESACLKLVQTTRRLYRVENRCALSTVTQEENIQNVASRAGDLTVVEPHHVKNQQKGGSTQPARAGVGGQTQVNMVTDENGGGAPQRTQKLNWAQITKIHRPDAKKVIPKLINDKI